MPIDPGIALGIKPPATPTSPLDEISKVMSLRNLMQEGQYRQAATERQKVLADDAQAQADQRNRDLADSNMFQKELLNTGDWEKAFAKTQGMIAPSNFLKYRESYDKTVEQHAKGNQEQRKADLANYSRLDNALNGVKVLDSSEQSQGYSNLLGELEKDQDLSPLIKQGISTGMIPRQFDPKHLDFLHAYVVGQKGILEEAEKRAQIPKIQQETDNAKLTGQETQNKLDQAALTDAGSKLAAAFRTGGDTGFKAAMGDLPYKIAQRFDGAGSEQEILKRAQTPEQISKAEQEAANANETKRFHDSEIANAAARLGLERKRLMQDEATGKLTPEALDKMAEMFATTGQIPSIGWGKNAAEMRSNIMNEAAKKYPNVQFATSKAAFQANQTSLSNITKQNDLITAYESTAGANLDRFLNTAKNVVDSKSPWINKPIRSLDQKGLGSGDMAAFNAARQVALSEISRVLTASPTGGGVVSDSARHEASELIGPDATLNQIYRAADILRQDMKTRLKSNNDQIASIKSRLNPEQTEQKPVQKWGRDKDGNPVLQ